MRKFVIAATALAFTGAAHAADMPLLQAPPPAPASWTGFYMGINGGGVWGKADTGLIILQRTDDALSSYFAGGGVGNVALTNNRVAVQGAASNAINYSGGVFGGQIGYLLQQGTIVGGLEAGFDWTGASASANVSSVYPGGVTNTAGALSGTEGKPFHFNEHVSSNWLFTFLGRVGFDLGAWYPYVTAGLALSDLKYSNTFTDPFAPTGPGGSAISINNVKAGVAAGAGLEWRWDNHWSLRGEYLFMEFSDINGLSAVCTNAGNCAPGTPTSQFSHHATFSESVARAFLSYKW
jgi:outer membrane immunogenic protein